MNATELESIRKRVAFAKGWEPRCGTQAFRDREALLAEVDRLNAILDDAKEDEYRRLGRLP